MPWQDNIALSSFPPPVAVLYPAPAEAHRALTRCLPCRHQCHYPIAPCFSHPHRAFLISDNTWRKLLMRLLACGANDHRRQPHHLFRFTRFSFLELALPDEMSSTKQCQLTRMRLYPLQCKGSGLQTACRKRVYFLFLFKVVSSS